MSVKTKKVPHVSSKSMDGFRRRPLCPVCGKPLVRLTPWDASCPTCPHPAEESWMTDGERRDVRLYGHAEHAPKGRGVVRKAADVVAAARARRASAQLDAQEGQDDRVSSAAQ